VNTKRYLHAAKATAFFVAAMGAASGAYAVDGCKILLCMAGPWKNIAECKKDVEKVLHDSAKGKPFPVCTMSDGGSAAAEEFNSELTCPPFYSYYDSETNKWASCKYPNKVDVYIDGQLWSRVHFDYAGNTSTWYSDAAKASLDPATLDPRYDLDKAIWDAIPVPPPPPESTGGD
jgi:hypothetical protein